jgi:glycosyltransferase involved in cell wall biosynthesis
MPHLTTQKTVLFIAPSAYPLGGVQTWLDYLLPGLQGAGFRTILGLSSGRYHKVDAYLSSHQFDQIEVRRIRAPSGTIQGRVEAIETLIQDVHADLIIVVNVIDAYQAINNLRYRGLSNAHIVTSIHGIQDDLFAGININSSIIDAVISTNRLTQKLIDQNANIEVTRSFYAPYGVKLMVSKFVNTPLVSNFTIAYVGRIEESQKRIADLLEIFSCALREIDNVNILIAGSGEDLPDLEQWMVQESQYSKQINYLGIIKPEDVAQSVYAKADVLLLTSEWETGPIVAWEAMNHGVCLVSSRYIGHHEEGSLIDNKNCLLFDIGDIEGAVKKIHLANDSSRRNLLNVQAKELIETKYSHAKSVEAWADRLTTVCLTAPKSYSTIAMINTDTGRLNLLLSSILGKAGLRFAERLRRLFSIKFDHQSPGSEWPHSYPSHNHGQISLDINVNDHCK